MHNFLSVFIQLPKQIEQYAIRINQQVSSLAKQQNQLQFTKFFKPHITLYFAKFPSENLLNIVRALESVEDLPRFDLEIDNELYHKSDQIFLKCSPFEQIYALHMQVLNSLNPYRQNLLRNKYRGNLQNYSTEQIDMIHQYGYPYVAKLFVPHISVAKISGIDTALFQKIEQSVKLEKSNFTVEKIQLIQSVNEKLSMDKPIKNLVYQLKVAN